jgi:hypothetical protein
MQDQKWRDLCWEAMHEKNVNKLLMIFLELDRATEGKPLELFSETVREYRQIGQQLPAACDNDQNAKWFV